MLKAPGDKGNEQAVYRMLLKAAYLCEAELLEFYLIRLAVEIGLRQTWKYNFNVWIFLRSKKGILPLCSKSKIINMWM